MQSTWMDKFTRAFFWFGFCVFLAASIPHIAAYYRHFDPNGGGFANSANWVISYLVAIVIDVTDVLVSIAVLKELNRGTPQRYLLGYWAFIVFVMALSWLINWQYNIVFVTQTFARADSQQIFGVAVGSLNPILGSAFQLLLLVYTAMAHKFAAKPVQKTAAQLRQEADELEQITLQQARIDAVKKLCSDNKVGGIFDSLGQAKERAKTLFGNDQQQAHAPARSSGVEMPVEEPGGEEPEEEIGEPVSGENIIVSDDVLGVLKTYPKIEALLSTGRPTFSLQEVSAATGFGVKLLANRLAKGELKHPARNDMRITRESLLSWLKTAPAARQGGKQRGKVVAFKAGQGEGQLEMSGGRT